MHHVPLDRSNVRSLTFRTVILAVFSLSLTGCSHFRPHILNTEYVYCTSQRPVFLRDRVAAVSNHTGTVNNGDKLAVLEHGRRFLRVRDPKGEMGWIEEKAVATQQTFDTFAKLGADHAKDPAIATAVVQDTVYLHIKPGRDTERFYLLAANDKIQLLSRATVPKPVIPGAQPKPTAKSAGEPPPPPAMEDWWLVRDAHNRTGWLYSRMMEVDVPDSITRYAESQRFIGAYILTTVNDPEAPVGAAPNNDNNVPVYITVLAPNRSGLPYDYDQVRLFTWNVKMHRYETGFREKNVEGYLPVTVGHQADPYGKSPTAQADLPSFTYRILAADAPPIAPDPATGLIKPTHLITKTYRLEGNTVHRVVAPNQPDQPEARPEPEPDKTRKGRKKR